MKAKKVRISCYGHNQSLNSECFRPDNERELETLIKTNSDKKLLARGAGLSYGDVCLNERTVLTERLNQFVRLDNNKLTAQSGVRLIELLRVSEKLSMAVIPGTLQASLGGAVANDVHGKNNSRYGSFGHQVEALELALPEQNIILTRKNHPDLFHATVGGLGLTGIIKRVQINMIEQSKSVKVKLKKYINLEQLFLDLKASQDDYQVAWLDLLNREKGLFITANSLQKEIDLNFKSHHLPFTLPFNLLNKWSMKLFNYCYYQFKKEAEIISDIVSFNNPLDKISHWDRVYGPKGLLQFQCVFPFDDGFLHYLELVNIIKQHRAVATLAVLKKFQQTGVGLLSFTQPGFSLAIDFANNATSINTIKALNQKVTECGGKV